MSKWGDVLNTKKLMLCATVILFMVGYFLFAIRPIKGFSWGDRIDLGDGYQLTMPFHAVGEVLDRDEEVQIYRPYFPLQETPMIPGGMAVVYFDFTYMRIFEGGVAEQAKRVEQTYILDNYFRTSMFEGNRVVLYVEDKTQGGCGFLYWLKESKPLLIELNNSPLLKSKNLRSRPVDELIADVMHRYGIKKVR